MLMTAYATFAHHDAALVQAVSGKALQMPAAFDPQAIANMLWALALLDDLSPSVWNCLLVALVQAESFNSKPTVAKSQCKPDPLARADCADELPSSCSARTPHAWQHTSLLSKQLQSPYTTP